ncbi:hypothetical protein NPIL_698761 [Nephila pilipes]|uniref:Uncharacterized protein n=1 Tax=Nephila pilipes TaxID=299642 RepID=A0A8X6PN40_NEPPI|nr:hypothetical protein NPIL_698761 [Nephila pilipes]
MKDKQIPKSETKKQHTSNPLPKRVSSHIKSSIPSSIVETFTGVSEPMIFFLHPIQFFSPYPSDSHYIHDENSHCRDRRMDTGDQYSPSVSIYLLNHPRFQTNKRSRGKDARIPQRDNSLHGLIDSPPSLFPSIRFIFLASFARLPIR